MDFWDSGINDGSVARKKATDYDTDGFKKKTEVESDPSLISIFLNYELKITVKDAKKGVIS